MTSIESIETLLHKVAELSKQIRNQQDKVDELKREIGRLLGRNSHSQRREV
jgi:chaperonin cofactor prefoldin